MFALQVFAKLRFIITVGNISIIIDAMLYFSCSIVLCMILTIIHRESNGQGCDAWCNLVYVCHKVNLNFGDSVMYGNEFQYVIVL